MANLFVANPGQAAMSGFQNALSTVYSMRGERRAQKEQAQREKLWGVQNKLWKEKLSNMEKTHKVDSILSQYEPGKEKEILSQVRKVDPRAAFELRKTFNSWSNEERQRKTQQFKIVRGLAQQILPNLDENTWDQGRWQYIQALQQSGLFTSEEVDKIGKSLPLNYDPQYVETMKRIYLKNTKIGPLPSGTMLQNGQLVKIPATPGAEMMLQRSQNKPMTQSSVYSALQRWYDTAVKPYQDRLGMGGVLRPAEQEEYQRLMDLYKQGLADAAQGKIPAVLQGEFPAEQGGPGEQQAPPPNGQQAPPQTLGELFQAVQSGQMDPQQAQFILKESFGIEQLMQNPQTGQIIGLINGQWIDLATGQPIQGQ